jgi:hypothetical protein
MKRILFIFLALVWLDAQFLPYDAFSDDAQARAIMERVNDREDGDSRISNEKMTLIDKNGKQRVRQLKSFSKDFDEVTRQILFFIEPADVYNTGFLTYDYDTDGKEDDQWLYLPALKKVRRIASSDKGSSFMGSDFTYGDMTRPELSKFDFTLIREEVVDDKPCWLIECKPRSQKIIDEYGYTKSIVLVRKDNHVVIRSVSWLKEPKKVKYMQVKKLTQIDDIWTVMEVHMTTRKASQVEHKTILRRLTVEYNQAIDQDLFTTRKMEMGL